MRRLLIIIGVFLVGVLLIISLAFSNKDKTTLTITFKNIKKVSVYRIDQKEAGVESSEQIEPLAELTESGGTVNVELNKSYLLRYEALPGYESGEEIIKAGGDKVTSLNPHYSKEKLKEILTPQIPAIQAVIKNAYPNITLYSIQPGELYEWGDWYGTTLLYTGPYTPSRDTLRLVMKKENGQWKIMTDPPNISLNKYEFPNIPVEILDEVNDQEVPKPKIM